MSTQGRTWIADFYSTCLTNPNWSLGYISGFILPGNLIPDASRASRDCGKKPEPASHAKHVYQCNRYIDTKTPPFPLGRTTNAIFRTGDATRHRDDPGRPLWTTRDIAMFIRFLSIYGGNLHFIREKLPYPWFCKVAATSPKASLADRLCDELTVI